MTKGRAYNRDISKRKALRKRRIAKEIYFVTFMPYKEWYDNLYQYSKNKIHCSCGKCARYRKTNNKGYRRKISGNYAPSRNYSARDKRKLNAMTFDERDNLQK